MTVPEAVTACRVCAAPIAPFMTFGRMPLANGFLIEADIPSEYFFELAPAFCPVCGMFQLMEQPAPARMFHGRYAFASSSSVRMQHHFKAFAQSVVRRALAGRRDPLVVEIGSNDGIMLGHLKDAGYRYLGIEPSTNVADLARARGIETVDAFFDAALAGRLRSQHGHAHAIIAANVMCHIPDIHTVAAGVAHWLAPDGVFIFEDPYLGDMIAKTSYDQIYDEHVFMFSATAVAAAFAPHGLALVDVMPQATHGGSMRYVLAHRGVAPESPSVAELIAREQQQGLGQPATYDQFRRNCEASRAALKALLGSLRARGARVAGYAATSKSTTVTNYCGIGPDELEFIADTTPLKHGTLSPGRHIPVTPREDFVRRPPDYALLFGWNHAAEIFANDAGFRASGGKWVTYVPRVEVID